MRFWPFIFLVGCTPVNDQLYNTRGEPIDYANVFMAPLCLFFCGVQLSTAGSKVNAGDNSSTSNSQSTSQTSGGFNQ